MDIDIDFSNRDQALKSLKHIPASRLEKGQHKRHNTGIYFQNIPTNPFTGLAGIDYEQAESRGYFKIDFLNVNAYKDVKNEDHIEKLLSIEPLWELLYEKEICDQLVHVNGHHLLLQQLKPRSIDELAMVLALIRPGKKHLIEKCKNLGFDAILDEIWIQTEDTYSFKKSHGVAYAHLIIMQLNLLCEKISYELS